MSSNNLSGQRIGANQVSGHYSTVNDALNRIDAAMTDGVAIGVPDTNAFDMSAEGLKDGFHFVIGNGATSATAAVTISLPASVERGLTFWRNTLAYPATITKTGGQTEPVVVIPPGGYALIEYAGSEARLASYCRPFDFTIAASDESTALTTGTGKVKWRNVGRKWITEVRASLNSAQSSGSLLAVDVNEGGASIFSTVLTIDNAATTSKTATTPAVISDNSIADDALMSIDIDTVGAGSPTGLKVTLIGYYY